MKLSARIPLLIGAVVLITCSAIIIAASVIAERNLTTAYINEITKDAESNAEIVKLRMDAQLDVLFEIANRARTRSMDWEGASRDSLAPDVTRIESLDIGLVFPDGTAHYVTDNSTSNLGDRDYVRKAFAGETSVSDIIISRVTGEQVVMFAAPVHETENFSSPVIGTLIARKDAKALSDLVASIKVNHKSGYAFLLNRSGTFSAHPDINMVTDAVNPIALS
ncbi:MAG: cache domain-containing protein, partial [Treponema sp.]|nr:cache domain-containing protein [Treponema sp.]